MSSSQPPLLPDATHDLARFATKTTFAGIPSDIIERIKFSFIDGLGVCLQGSPLPWTQKVYEIPPREVRKTCGSTDCTFGREQQEPVAIRFVHRILADFVAFAHVL